MQFGGKFLQLRVIFKKKLKSYEITVLYAVITLLPFSVVFFEKIEVLVSDSPINIYYFTIAFLSIVTLIEFFLQKPYLTLIFGCHNLCERSFKIKNYYFPICARCTGIFFGIYFSFMKFVLDYHYLYSLLIMIPLILDGLFQRYTSYRSNNLKRVISGFLFGIASIEILLFTVYVNRLIFELDFNWIY